MTRLFVAAAAVLLLGGGMALADDAWLVKVDPNAQTITVKLGDKDAPAKDDKTLDAKRLKLLGPGGKDINLDDFNKLGRGTHLEYKTWKGNVTELKVPAVTKN
jgi:hypothetical protein